MKKAALVLIITVLMHSTFCEELVFVIGQWPPFTFDNKTGLSTEIVIAICKSTELQCRIEYLPWIRAEKAVESGKVFATYPYAITESRGKGFIFSDPILYSPTAVLLNSESNVVKYDKIQTIEHFRNAVVGITNGSNAIIEPLQKIGAKIEATETIEQSYTKLKVKRIDYLIEDEHVVDYLLNTLGRDGIIKITDTYSIFPKREYRIMVSKNYNNAEHYVKLINKGLMEIKKSGEYNRILAKY